MKRKLLMSAFVLVISVAMIAAATMAWFTDIDDAGEAIFQAGTVSIEAGSYAIFSHYFDPGKNIFLYGVIEKQDNTSGLYEINIQTGEANLIFDIDAKGYDTYSPNGLAFDKANKRLYYSMVKSNKSDLYFYDFKTKERVKSGTIDGLVYCATFYNGSYWYIKNNTDNVVEVKFDSNGYVSVVKEIKDITGDLNKKFGFGDVVFDIKDGILYGSTTEQGNVFFSYEIGKPGSYREINKDKKNGAINLQIAFGSDGNLYGHSTNTGDWYLIELESGVKSKLDGMPTDNRYNDLASGYISVWNPGDVDYMKYYVTNTGSKRIRVRAKIGGDWKGNLDNSVVSITLADENWTDEYGDGYYYYKGVVKPNDSVELKVKIELNGPNTGNEYQGKTFKLTGTMEAIQASNGAPLDQWGVDIDEKFPVN